MLRIIIHFHVKANTITRVRTTEFTVYPLGLRDAAWAKVGLRPISTTKIALSSLSRFACAYGDCSRCYICSPRQEKLQEG